MKSQILFVLEEVPYPPRRTGYSIRFYPLLESLGRTFDLDIALIVNPEAGTPELGALQSLVRKVVVCQRIGIPSLADRLAMQMHRLLPNGVPYDFLQYGTESIIDQLIRCAPEQYDCVVWARHSHLLTEFLSRYRGDNVVVDAVDSTTLWMSAGSAANGILGAARLSKVRRWELSLCRDVRKTFYISVADAKTITQRMAGGSVEVMPNGVYLGDYRSTKLQLEGPSIGYLGNMSYAPNIDAVRRLARIFKSLKRDVASAKLYIIGRDPSPEVQALAAHPDVVVTGAVEDIWSYVNAVDVFVLPVFLGAGQQNKLLEVLCAGNPEIVSSVANRGVGAEHGSSVIVADGEQEMVQAAVELLASPQARQDLGQAGRKFVLERYSWEAIGKRYARALVDDRRIDG